MTQRYVHFATFLCLVALAATPQPAQAQGRDPITLDQIVRMIESGVFSDTRIITLAEENCLAFRVNDEAVRRLVDAGGSEALIGALRDRVCVNIPPVVTYVTVTPSQLQVPMGANRIVRAMALRPDSSQIPGVTFQWSAEDTSIADVSAGGTVLGKRPGRTRVVASTTEGPTGSATVTVVRTAAGAAEGEEAEQLPPGAKSVGTATALGVLLPGGGEFYTGNTAKGLGIVVGSAAAVVAGLLITSEDTLDLAFIPTGSPTGPGSAREYPGEFEFTIDETGYFVVGAAVAGALWVYGLVDGILAAKKSRRIPVEAEMEREPGLSLQIAPVDGVRIARDGTTEITLIRIGS